MIQKKIVKLLLIITIIMVTHSLPLIAQKVHKVPLQKQGYSLTNRSISWNKTCGEIIWNESSNEIFIKINYKNTNKEIKLYNTVWNTYNLETVRNKKGNTVTISRWSKGNAICENYEKVNIILKHIYPVNKAGVISYNAARIELVIISGNKQTVYLGTDYDIISYFKFK